MKDLLDHVVLVEKTDIQINGTEYRVQKHIHRYMANWFLIKALR